MTTQYQFRNGLKSIQYPIWVSDFGRVRIETQVEQTGIVHHVMLDGEYYETWPNRSTAFDRADALVKEVEWVA